MNEQSIPFNVFRKDFDFKEWWDEYHGYFEAAGIGIGIALEIFRTFKYQKTLSKIGFEVLKNIAKL